MGPACLSLLRHSQSPSSCAEPRCFHVLQALLPISYHFALVLAPQEQVQAADWVNLASWTDNSLTSACFEPKGCTGSDVIQTSVGF